MAKIKYLACLGSSMYQRTVDELQDELNSFEHRLSTSATTAFYKRKIYDLEAICCADLNRVKSRFVRSLQAFENTIDSIEEPRSRRIGVEGCRCSKNHLTGYNVDAYRHERPAARNAKHDRSLPRSKSVTMESNRNLWLTYMCKKRYSDSEMYSKTYRSMKSFEDSQTADINDFNYRLRFNKSFTMISSSNGEISNILF